MPTGRRRTYAAGPLRDDPYNDPVFYLMIFVALGVVAGLQARDGSPRQSLGWAAAVLTAVGVGAVPFRLYFLALLSVCAAQAALFAFLISTCRGRRENAA